MDDDQPSKGRIPEARHAAKALLKAAAITEPPVSINSLIPHISKSFDLIVKSTTGLPSGVDAILHQ